VVIDPQRVADAVQQVFGQGVSSSISGSAPSPNLGGTAAIVTTPSGELWVLDTDGQVILGSFRGVEPLLATPTVSLAAALTRAQALVNRVYPWAAHLTPSTELVSHGATATYEMEWRQSVNNILMPSWVHVTANGNGDVIAFSANYFPVVAAPPVTVTQEQAVATALVTLPPQTSLQKARLEMGMFQGVLHTFWNLEFLTAPPPNFTGYVDMPGHVVMVDALTGTVLPPSP
jgi:hypothetical protein